MKVIFVDTNYFLQIRAGPQLPWSDVFREDEIVLLVPRAVTRELDRLKQDGNKRRARRAKKAIKDLRELVQAPDQSTTIRESGPRVTMRLAPRPDLSLCMPQGLDKAIADDCIVAEALAYSQANPSESVSLLSNDIGAMFTAREYDLNFVSVPEGWMLPPEPDENNKAVTDLERRVTALEEKFPIVAIEALDSAEKTVGTLRLVRQRYTPLTDTCLEVLLREVAERCPLEEPKSSSGLEAIMRTTALAASGGRYDPPTEDEIRKYTERDYPAWLEAVRTILSGLSQRLNRQQCPVDLVLSLTNSGVVPAMNAVLEIEACAGVRLHSPTDEEPSSDSRPIRIPQPPRPPQGRWLNTYGSSALAVAASFAKPDLSSLWTPEFRPPNRRDRNAFYWKAKEAKPTAYLALECEEFRHRQPPEEFRIVVIIPERGGESSNIECKFSASNLPEPTVLNVPVRVEYRLTDPEPEARRMISELRRTLVRGTLSIDAEAFDL